MIIKLFLSMDCLYSSWEDIQVLLVKTAVARPAPEVSPAMQGQGEIMAWSGIMYRLKLRIRFVLSDKTARQKARFLSCSRRRRRRAGLIARR
jgi:hypothetical protein